MKLHLITGSDTFKVIEHSKNIITEICGADYKNHPDLEIIKGDKEGVSANEILASVLDTLRTPPFLTPQKIVWLKHFSYFEDVLKGNAATRKGSPMEGLTNLIKDILPDDMNDVFAIFKLMSLQSF